jgi:magnesium-transporting ATPase (P-type)
MDDLDVRLDRAVTLPRTVEDLDEGPEAPYPGLTATEAIRRLEQDGANTLPTAPAPPAWRALAGQLLHFFALMLWGAAILAAIAGMPQLSVAIVVIIVVNGLFAFAQGLAPSVQPSAYGTCSHALRRLSGTDNR